MKIDLKKEYLDSVKDILGEEYFNKYLNELEKSDTHGLTINNAKLKKSSIDLQYILDRFDAKLVYSNDDFHYIIYDKNVLMKKSIFPGKDALYHAGLYYIQEPSAAEVIYNFDVKEDDIVLDLCASPGGKSIEALYSLKKEAGGFLVSNEVKYERAKILSSNIERMGFDNVAITCEEVNSLTNIFYDFFDKIIVDAPCSGEGMFRKSEEARNQWSRQLVESCANIQKKILTNAYLMLKNGGEMVYSTCTFNRVEDEEVIDYILKEHNDLEIVKMQKIWPFNSLGEGQFYCILKKGGENAMHYSINKKKFDGIRLIRYKAVLDEKTKYGSVPSHASTHIDDVVFDNVVELDDDEIEKYLKGESIRKELKFSGFCKITYKNLGVGLAKYANGILKNHYPKGLRNF